MSFSSLDVALEKNKIDLDAEQKGKKENRLQSLTQEFVRYFLDLANTEN